MALKGNHELSISSIQIHNQFLQKIYRNNEHNMMSFQSHQIMLCSFKFLKMNIEDNLQSVKTVWTNYLSITCVRLPPPGVCLAGGW